MECPICRNAFSKAKEILMIVDRGFYCHHCGNQLISYPYEKDGLEGDT